LAFILRTNSILQRQTIDQYGLWTFSRGQKQPNVHSNRYFSGGNFICSMQEIETGFTKRE